MQINLTSKGFDIALTLPPSVSARWQPGQILDARVLRADADGRLLLQLQGQTLEARSQLPLRSGEVLQLRVEQEAGRLLLRLLEPAGQPPSIVQAWRQALPRQLPLAEALQAIARLARLDQPAASPTSTAPPAAPAGTPAAMPTPVDDALPPAVREAAERLFAQLPGAARLTTPDGLRQALLNSGIFFLARLARGDSAALEQDVQAMLWRLLGTVGAAGRGMPASNNAQAGKDNAGEILLRMSALLQQMNTQTEGALSRLKVQQLHTQAGQNDPNPAWLLELPVRHGQELELLQLRIQRDPEANGEGRGNGWSVRLHFDDRRNGAVDALVNWSGSKVGVRFWAERADTAQHFAQRLDELESRLQHCGLEVERLQSGVGAPPPAADIPTPSGLVNLKA